MATVAVCGTHLEVIRKSRGQSGVWPKVLQKKFRREIGGEPYM